MTFQIQDVQHRNGLLWGYFPISKCHSPNKGDDSSRGSRNFHASGSYTRRGRDINRFGTGAVATGQLDDATEDMDKMKVMHEHIWCTTCRSEGHQRDEFLVLPNYVAMGAPNPFPSGKMEWCEICRQWGHVPPHFPTLQKYQTMTHTPFCKFCKSIGHDVNSCHSLQLMQDNTHDAFWVQEEQKGGERGGMERGRYQGGP
jgi:hypothetical protein